MFLLLIFFYADVVDLGVNNNYIWITIVLFDFGLAITESSGYGESSRYDSDRPASHGSTGTSEHNVLILVNLATSLQYSLLLTIL